MVRGCTKLQVSAEGGPQRIDLNRPERPALAHRLAHRAVLLNTHRAPRCRVSVAMTRTLVTAAITAGSNGCALQALRTKQDEAGWAWPEAPCSSPTKRQRSPREIDRAESACPRSIEWKRAQK